MDDGDGFPRFSDKELGRRCALVRTMMDREGLAALLAYGTTATHSEVQFLADFHVTREAMLTFPREGEPTLFVQFFNHVPNARRVARVEDVRWGGIDTTATVAEDLRSRGLAGQRIGLVGPLPWQRYETLRRALPAATLVDATMAMQRLRLVKSAEELAFLRRGAALSDLAVEALEREARPGITEYDLAAIVEGAYLRLGGQTHIHYMGTTPMRQPSLCVPAQQLSGRVLARGDVLITEISAAYWGYSGQVHRAYAIAAEPTPAYREIHDVAVEAYARIVAVLRDGATATQVLDAADVIHERGYTVYDDLFHGMSQLPPILQTRQTQRGPFREFTFRAGMCVVVQPNVIRDDSARMGLQVGSTLVITRDGAEDLHRYPMRFVVCGG